MENHSFLRHLFTIANNPLVNRIRGFAFRLTLLSLLFAAAGCPNPVEEIPTIELAGTPAEIGAAWGDVNGLFIREEMARFAAYADREVLLARGQRFIEICSLVAPHWLEEAEAIANATGVDPELYAVYAGTIYRNLYQYDECTSYAVSHNYTRNNAVFFHKTRDNVEKPQAALKAATSSP